MCICHWLALALALALATSPSPSPSWLLYPHIRHQHNLIIIVCGWGSHDLYGWSHDLYVCGAGFPQPIQESIKVLREHIYQPLSDFHVKQEEDLERQR